MSGSSVTLDTTKLEKGTKQLVAGIKRDANPAADKTAGTVADRLRPLIPVKTGTLRDTVQTNSISDGAEVHYGGDTKYAEYIANRTGCTDRALTGADRLFQQAMRLVAKQEVHRL